MRESLPKEIEFEDVNMDTVWGQIDALSSPYSPTPDRASKLLRVLFDEDGSVSKTTYKEAGKIFNISGERVRQLKSRYIRQLKHPVRYNKLISVKGDK